MFNGDYVDAINLYQNIIEDPLTSEIDVILAELSQAYSYYLLSEADPELRNGIMVELKYKPEDLSAYLETQNEIYGKISQLLGDDGFEEELPEIYEFKYTNYPNPFNPETTIAFTLPKENRTILNIYNIRGQRVRSLWNDTLSEGHHKIVWNGRDENDRQVGSGVYFYRIESGEFKATQKMLLLK